MKKAVTLEDIGRALNLSRSTISRAMNLNPVVNEATRTRVLATAKELGFVPNRAARSLVLNRQINIAVVVFSEPVFFWRDVQSGVQRAAKELRDFRVNVEFFAPDISDPGAQNRILRELVHQGVDAVAISPNDPFVVAEAIEELADRGIPVLTISADVPGSKRMGYVGCDYFRAGRIAGDVMARLLAGKGTVSTLSFPGTVQAITQRIAGFREVMSQYPSISLDPPCVLSRTGEETRDFITSLLTSRQDISGIYVSYGVLEQAGQAIRDLGLNRKPLLIGYDMSEGIASLMRDGVIDATICQEPFNQGYYPVKILADRLLEGRSPARDIINTKLEIVTRENLPYYEHSTEDYALLFDI